MVPRERGLPGGDRQAAVGRRQLRRVAVCRWPVPGAVPERLLRVWWYGLPPRVFVCLFCFFFFCGDQVLFFCDLFVVLMLCGWFVAAMFTHHPLSPSPAPTRRFSACRLPVHGGQLHLSVRPWFCRRRLLLVCSQPVAQPGRREPCGELMNFMRKHRAVAMDKLCVKRLSDIRKVPNATPPLFHSAYFVPSIPPATRKPSCRFRGRGCRPTATAPSTPPWSYSTPKRVSTTRSPLAAFSSRRSLPPPPFWAPFFTT